MLLEAHTQTGLSVSAAAVGQIPVGGAKRQVFSFITNGKSTQVLESVGLTERIQP